MKKILLSVTVAAALGSMAMAGGDYVPAVPVAPMDSWSGPYVGAHVGYIWGDADVTIDDWNGPGQDAHANGLNVDGFLGGVFAGYNWRLQDDWLVGVEVGFNWMSNDDEKMFESYDSNPGAPDYGYIKNYYKVKQDWEASIVGRVGKIMEETYLPYILAGISWTKLEGRYKHEEQQINGWTTSESNWDSDTVMGFTVGVGVEYKFNENLHARLEYRYNNYQKADLHHQFMGRDLDSHIDYNTNVITAGIVYKF